MNMTLTRPRRHALAALILAPALVAAPQLPGGNAPGGNQQGPQGQQPGVQQPGVQEQQPQQQGQDPFGYDAFNRPFMPFNTGVAPEQGFPTFAPGIYPPAPPDWMKPPGISGLPSALPMLPTNPDWPSWVKAKLDRELPYAPDQAVLVRDSDRVWLRTPDEEVFVPLYFFDKLRAVTVGTAVEVRQTGGFQLVFHGGSRLTASGTAALRIATLDEQLLRLEVTRFTHLWLVSIGREQRLQLPDGSELRIAAGEATDGRAEVHIERADEPGWYGGRATMFNAGQRAVVWHTPFGDREILPGYIVTFFLQPSPLPLGTDLQTDAVTTRRTGASLEATPSGGNGAVTWLGARFQLPPGSRLVLDPLLGDPFTPPAAEPPPAVTLPK